jgi:dTDP-glucose pyrophosphorylase
MGTLNWEKVIVRPDMPLSETISRIDSAALQVGLVVDELGQLKGIVTDGDIRRAILRGVSLDARSDVIMSCSPRVLPVGTPGSEVLAFMRRHAVHHVPIIDNEGQLVGLEVLDELIGTYARPNWVVIMAGGLGTRLRPLTEDCPKPLLPVGGKPILENILESFAEQGFRKIFLSINYKADLIRNHFGDGARWGVQIEYLHEMTRLGTAGALSLLPSWPEDSLIVMNGDLLTHANFETLLEFHREHGAVATMAVREYDFQVPYGVVRISGDRITAIEEKPVQSFFVNAGIYVLSPQAFELIPQATYFDMPALFERMINKCMPTSAYPLREYWLDVGRLDEFERAQTEWIPARKSNND